MRTFSGWHERCLLRAMRRVARVAVAEDDPDMRGLVADALRRDGYRIVDFADGAELSHEVVEPTGEPLDLIVSDIHMPLVTGLAVLRGLRESRSRVPVVLMTGFGDESVRAEAARLDAVLFDKPFRLEDLRSVVRRLLEDAGDAAPPSSTVSSERRSDAKLAP